MSPALSDALKVAAPIAVALAGLLAGLLIRRTVLRRLTRSADASRTRLDNLIVAAVRGPVVLWCFVAGLYVAVQLATLPPDVTVIVGKALVVLVILSITWAAAQMAAAIVQSAAVGTAGVLPAATLIVNITRILVLGIGLLVVLQTLGISITPIITALGVGGLAVALALQDTLANLFAGIHILAARQVRAGDYIRLSSGEEGYVVDVTWRQTTVRQLPNNIIIVPNSKLASAILTNYNLPETEMSVLVEVGVHYASDLEQVERVTIEVAREVLRDVEGGVTSFDPFIRYHTFGDFSIGFTAILRVTEFIYKYPVKHEFVKRLHRRYNEEGIVIPFPIRTLEFPEEAREIAQAIKGRKS